MSLQHQLYLDLFERYHKRGVEAHRDGKGGLARRSFLQAAEVLFKLAGESEGQLQKSRKQRAAKLLALAKSIPADGGKTRGGNGAAMTSDEGETPADGDKKWQMADIPDISMDDVAGLADVKAIIRKRVVYPFLHPKITKRYRKQIGGGVLLYGPPGTGKTMIAKAIANEVDAAFFSVRCSDIMSKWVGEAEGNLRELFAEARRCPRAVIFFDETEAIVARRGGNSTVMNRVIPEFLSQVDGMGGRHEGLLLLGATNRPWDMDEAALRPGRFGELIYVPLPDDGARRKIIAETLIGLPLAEDVDIEYLVGQTAGYSGADCVAMCEAAKDGPYEREIDSGVVQRLESSDFRQAIERTKSSVSAKLLVKFDNFSK